MLDANLLAQFRLREQAGQQSLAFTPKTPIQIRASVAQMLLQWVWSSGASSHVAMLDTHVEASDGFLVKVAPPTSRYQIAPTHR